MNIPSFLDDPFDWCKDVIMPGLGVFATGTIALLGWRHRVKEQDEAQGKADERERLHQENIDDANINRRIQMLIEGYEHRLTDLTDEIKSLRSEVRSLRDELEHHRQVCATCPHRIAIYVPSPAVS
jgi:hypothetical protein